MCDFYFSDSQNASGNINAVFVEELIWVLEWIT